MTRSTEADLLLFLREGLFPKLTRHRFANIGAWRYGQSGYVDYAHQWEDWFLPRVVKPPRVPRHPKRMPHD